MKHFLIHLPLWDRHVLVVLGGLKDEIIEAAKIHGIERAIVDVISDPPSEGDEACEWDKEGESIVWFETFENTIYYQSVIVHEVDHVFYSLSRWVGFLDEPEGNAYGRADLYSQIMTKFTETL